MSFCLEKMELMKDNWISTNFTASCLVLFTFDSVQPPTLKYSVYLGISDKIRIHDVGVRKGVAYSLGCVLCTIKFSLCVKTLRICSHTCCARFTSYGSCRRKQPLYIPEMIMMSVSCLHITTDFIQTFKTMTLKENLLSKTV